jgi:predicted RNA-binding Zn-ribbon protein involved in translation (DUF1610 family)
MVAAILFAFLAFVTLWLLISWRSSGSLSVRPIMVAALMLPMLMGAAFALHAHGVHRMRTAVLDHRGAVCTKCEYPLPDDESGTCPECGTFYTRQSNAAFWGVPYTKPGAQENQDEPSEPRPEEQTEHGNKSS